MVEAAGRVLVTGAGGMLGGQVMRDAPEGVAVVGTTRADADLADPGQVARLFAEKGPFTDARVRQAVGYAVRRQDVPAVYDVTTCVYVGDPDYILSCERLMQGRVGYVEIPVERALDIDTEFDLYLADLMLGRPYRPGRSE